MQRRTDKDNKKHDFVAPFELNNLESTVKDSELSL
jgi:hypothetical protein